MADSQTQPERSGITRVSEREYPEMPNPTANQLASPSFNALWDLMKSWDVNVPEFYEGYCHVNGSHVALILNTLQEAAR